MNIDEFKQLDIIKQELILKDALELVDIIYNYPINTEEIKIFAE
jgi:hypothetical protein